MFSRPDGVTTSSRSESAESGRSSDRTDRFSPPIWIASFTMGGSASPLRKRVKGEAISPDGPGCVRVGVRGLVGAASDTAGSEFLDRCLVPMVPHLFIAPVDAPTQVMKTKWEEEP